MGRLISTNELKVYEYIKANPVVTRKQIQNALGLKKDAVKLYITNLLKIRRLIKEYPTEKRPAKYVEMDYDVNSNHDEQLTDAKSTVSTRKRIAITDEEITTFIRNNPGCTVNEFAVMFNISNPGAWGRLQKLVDNNVLVKQSVTNQDRRLEYKYFFNFDKELLPFNEPKTSESLNNKVAKTNKASLDDFTPRELMLELVKKGYSGKLNTTVKKELQFEVMSTEHFEKLKNEGYTGIVVIERDYEISLSSL